MRPAAHPHRIALAILVVSALAGCAPAEPAPPTLAAPRAHAGGAVWLAGDDASTPLVRHLVRRFQAASPGPRIRVLPSPGADGADRARGAGVLDGSFRLAAAAAQAEDALAIARTEAVLLVGAGVPGPAAVSAGLAEVASGRARVWPGGRPASIVRRGVAHPAESLALDGRVAAATLDAAGWAVIPGEAAARDAVQQTPGAVGFGDLGSLEMAAAPLRAYAVRGGALVVHVRASDPPAPRLADFLRWTRSPDGRAVVSELGYEAIEEPLP